MLLLSARSISAVLGSAQPHARQCWVPPSRTLSHRTPDFLLVMSCFLSSPAQMANMFLTNLFGANMFVSMAACRWPAKAVDGSVPPSRP